MKIKADVGSVIKGTDREKKLKPTTIINNDHSKLFDSSGKLLKVATTTPKIDELDLLKTTTKPVAKKVGKKVTTPKEEKLYKYNTSTKELLKIRETLRKENANNPIIKEIDGKIEKRRANWKKFYDNNREKYAQWSKNWRKQNVDKVKASQQRYVEKKKAETPTPAKKTTTKSKKSSKKSTKKSSKKNK